MSVQRNSPEELEISMYISIKLSKKTFLSFEADGRSAIVRDLNLCSANLHLQITIAGGTHSDLTEVGG